MFHQTEQMLVAFQLGKQIAQNKTSIACSFCSSTEDVKQYNAGSVCDKCWFLHSTQEEE